MHFTSLKEVWSSSQYVYQIIFMHVLEILILVLAEIELS